MQALCSFYNKTTFIINNHVYKNLDIDVEHLSLASCNYSVIYFILFCSYMLTSCIDAARRRILHHQKFPLLKYPL